MAIAQTLDVGGQVEADGSVPDGVHRLGIEEVVRPCCRKDTNRSVREGGGGRLKTAGDIQTREGSHGLLTGS